MLQSIFVWQKKIDKTHCAVYYYMIIFYYNKLLAHVKYYYSDPDENRFSYIIPTYSIQLVFY